MLSEIIWPENFSKSRKFIPLWGISKTHLCGTQINNIQTVRNILKEKCQHTTIFSDRQSILKSWFHNSFALKLFSLGIKTMKKKVNTLIIKIQRIFKILMRSFHIVLSYNTENTIKLTFSTPKSNGKDRPLWNLRKKEKSVPSRVKVKIWKEHLRNF